MDKEHKQLDARERAEKLVAQRGLDWIGYDGENLVSDAICGEPPDVVRELLYIYKRSGRNPLAELYAGDKDGISGVSLALKNNAMKPVLEEFGVEVYRPNLLPGVPGPESDVYEIYREQVENGLWEKRVAVQRMATLAYERHKGVFRKPPDGRPYIVHPQAVYEMLLKDWGFTEENDVVSLCVAWGHDLLEDARPEDRDSIADDIVKAGGRWGDEVLAEVRTLSFIPPENISDGEYDALKAEYIRTVADTASPGILAVKMADRLCNTLDFAKSDKDRARRYLEKGRCLFRRIDEIQRADSIRKTLEEVDAVIG